MFISPGFMIEAVFTAGQSVFLMKLAFLR
jgi:hypothetical protein